MRLAALSVFPLIEAFEKSTAASRGGGVVVPSQSTAATVTSSTPTLINNSASTTTAPTTSSLSNDSSPSAVTTTATTTSLQSAGLEQLVDDFHDDDNDGGVPIDTSLRTNILNLLLSLLERLPTNALTNEPADVLDAYARLANNVARHRRSNDESRAAALGAMVGLAVLRSDAVPLAMLADALSSAHVRSNASPAASSSSTTATNPAATMVRGDSFVRRLNERWSCAAALPLAWGWCYIGIWHLTVTPPGVAVAINAMASPNEISVSSDYFEPEKLRMSTSCDERFLYICVEGSKTLSRVGLGGGNGTLAAHSYESLVVPLAVREFAIVKRRMFVLVSESTPLEALKIGTTTANNNSTSSTSSSTTTATTTSSITATNAATSSTTTTAVSLSTTEFARYLASPLGNSMTDDDLSHAFARSTQTTTTATAAAPSTTTTTTVAASSTTATTTTVSSSTAATTTTSATSTVSSSVEKTTPTLSIVVYNVEELSFQSTTNANNNGNSNSFTLTLLPATPTNGNRMRMLMIQQQH
jgi:hypothetical protein